MQGYMQPQRKNPLDTILSVGQIAGGVATANPMLALSGASGLARQQPQAQPAPVGNDALQRQLDKLNALRYKSGG